MKQIFLAFLILFISWLTVPRAFAYQPSTRIHILGKFNTTGCKITINRYGDGDMSDYIQISSCDGNNNFNKELSSRESESSSFRMYSGVTSSGRYYILVYQWDSGGGSEFAYFTIGIIYFLELIIILKVYLLVKHPIVKAFYFIKSHPEGRERINKR